MWTTIDNLGCEPFQAREDDCTKERESLGTDNRDVGDKEKVCT